MKQNRLDLLGMREFSASLEQLASHTLPFRAGQSRESFDTDDGNDFAAPSHTDQCCAGDRRMSVENGLARDGEQRLAGQDHAVRLASAEPEPSLVVEITE